MKRHRVMITRATLTAVALLAFAPVGAPASSLLSGYGGPGQGSLLFGVILLPLATGSKRASAGANAHRGPARGSQATGVTGGATSATGSQPASRTPETGAGSSTLGLSGTDLVYILAVFGALATIAALMRGIARGPRAGAPD